MATLPVYVQFGEDHSETLQFVPKYVTVDNPTSNWIYLVQSRRGIPPFTTNYTVAWNSNTLAVEILSTPTIPNSTVPAYIPSTSGVATCTFTDQEIGPTPGTNVNPTGAQLTLANGVTNSGFTQQTATYSLPTGCVGIAVLWVNQNNGTMQLKVQGTTSGFTYINAPTIYQNGSIAKPIYPVIDPQVTVYYTSVKFWLVALFDLATVNVVGNGDSGTLITQRGPQVFSNPILYSPLNSNTLGASFASTMRFIRRIFVVMYQMSGGGTGGPSDQVIDLVSNDGSIIYAQFRLPLTYGGQIETFNLEFDDLPLQAGTNGQYGMTFRTELGAPNVGISGYVLGYVGNSNVG